MDLAFSVINAAPLVKPEGIKWKLNGSSIDVNSNSRYNFSSDRRTLTINNALLADQGIYTLNASNEIGHKSESIELIVDGKSS